MNNSNALRLANLRIELLEAQRDLLARQLSIHEAGAENIKNMLSSIHDDGRKGRFDTVLDLGEHVAEQALAAYCRAVQLDLTVGEATLLLLVVMEVMLRGAAAGPLEKLSSETHVPADMLPVSLAVMTASFVAYAGAGKRGRR